MTSATGQTLVSDYYDRAREVVHLLKDCLIAERVWGQIRVIVGQIKDNHITASIESYEEMVCSLKQNTA